MFLSLLLRFQVLRPVRCRSCVDFVAAIIQVGVCVVETRTGRELRRGCTDLTWSLGPPFPLCLALIPCPFLSRKAEDCQVARRTCVLRLGLCCCVYDHRTLVSLLSALTLQLWVWPSTRMSPSTARCFPGKVQLSKRGCSGCPTVALVRGDDLAPRVP